LPPHHISATICGNDSLLFAGTYLHNAGTYSHIGCDSSVILALSVSALDSISQFGGLCAGDSFNFYGRWIHTPGGYDTVVAGSPCDTFVALFLAVQDPLPPHHDTAVICGNDSLLFAGTYLHTGGTYSHIGCDSSVILALTVLPATSTISQTICWDQNYFGYDTTGTYTDTFITGNGCVGIRTLYLTVTPAEITYDTQTICTGQSYLGHNATGNYTDTITGINACDKLRHLDLTVLPNFSDSITVSICQGQSYQGHTINGMFADSFTSVHGCDSIVTVSLTVLPDPIQPTISQQNDSLISSEATRYQWYLNDTLLAGDTGSILIATQTGNYQVNITGPNGCTQISAGYAYVFNGIVSLSSGFDVKVYPNPNGGAFTVELSDNNPKEVTITDVLGQIVMPAKTVAGKEEFDLSALSGGIYTLGIKDPASSVQWVFKQVVIQH
jgi:hypothetical protein